jgi:hypothetical protein
MLRGGLPQIQIRCAISALIRSESTVLQGESRR